MSNYTPTTEEVRGAYEGQLIKVGDNAYQLLDEAHAKAEFDRWLAEVKAQEQLRIKEIINKETFHYGKTHYEGINCVVCRIYTRIDDDK